MALLVEEMFGFKVYRYIHRCTMYGVEDNGGSCYDGHHA